MTKSYCEVTIKTPLRNIPYSQLFQLQYTHIPTRNIRMIHSLDIERFQAHCRQSHRTRRWNFHRQQLIKCHTNFRSTILRFFFISPQFCATFWTTFAPLLLAQLFAGRQSVNKTSTMLRQPWCVKQSLAHTRNPSKIRIIFNRIGSVVRRDFGIFSYGQLLYIVCHLRGDFLLYSGDLFFDNAKLL